MERGGDEELEECLRGYKAWNLRKQNAYWEEKATSENIKT
jgi:hypothetical protein